MKKAMSNAELSASYQRMKVPDLKSKCREKGLTMSGLKQELVDRLMEYERKSLDKPQMVPMVASSPSILSQNSPGMAALSSSPLVPASPAIGMPAAVPSAPVSQVAPLVSQILQPGRKASDIQLCVVMDCSGSMQMHFKSLMQSYLVPVLRLLKGATEKTASNVEVSVVFFRDYPPCADWMIKAHSFTKDEATYKGWLDEVSCEQGGFAENAVCEALCAATHQKGWRPDAQKFCLLLSNSAPHEVPCRYHCDTEQDVYKHAEKMAQADILLSVVTPRRISELFTIFQKAKLQNGQQLKETTQTGIRKTDFVLLRGLSLPLTTGTVPNGPIPSTATQSPQVVTAATASNPSMVKLELPPRYMPVTVGSATVSNVATVNATAVAGSVQNRVVNQVQPPLRSTVSPVPGAHPNVTSKIPARPTVSQGYPTANPSAYNPNVNINKPTFPSNPASHPPQVLNTGAGSTSNQDAAYLIAANLVKGTQSNQQSIQTVSQQNSNQYSNQVNYASQNQPFIHESSQHSLPSNASANMMFPNQQAPPIDLRLKQAQQQSVQMPHHVNQPYNAIGMPPARTTQQQVPSSMNQVLNQAMNQVAQPQRSTNAKPIWVGNIHVKNSSSSEPDMFLCRLSLIPYNELAQQIKADTWKRELQIVKLVVPPRIDKSLYPQMLGVVATPPGAVFPNFFKQITEKGSGVCLPVDGQSFLFLTVAEDKMSLSPANPSFSALLLPTTINLETGQQQQQQQQASSLELPPVRMFDPFMQAREKEQAQRMMPQFSRPFGSELGLFRDDPRVGLMPIAGRNPLQSGLSGQREDERESSLPSWLTSGHSSRLPDFISPVRTSSNPARSSSPLSVHPSSQSSSQSEHQFKRHKPDTPDTDSGDRNADKSAAEEYEEDELAIEEEEDKDEPQHYSPQSTQLHEKPTPRFNRESEGLDAPADSTLTLLSSPSSSLARPLLNPPSPSTDELMKRSPTPPPSRSPLAELYRSLSVSPTHAAAKERITLEPMRSDLPQDRSKSPFGLAQLRMESSAMGHDGEDEEVEEEEVEASGQAWTPTASKTDLDNRPAE
eukprot:GILK01006169.1.p1 GENE.GILK01006169.1~~GILK01006169.1.p1  ORF type:complete len:1062 (-),score=237.88 GILK01006169.1:151-3336(-)